MLILLVAVNHVPEKYPLDLKLCLQSLSGPSVYDMKQRLKTYQLIVIQRTLCASIDPLFPF